MVFRDVCFKKSLQRFTLYALELLRKLHPNIDVFRLELPVQLCRHHDVLKYVFNTSFTVKESNAYSPISSHDIQFAVDQLLESSMAEEVNTYCKNIVNDIYNNDLSSRSLNREQCFLQRIFYNDYLSEDGSLYLAALVKYLAHAAVNSAVEEYLTEE